MFLIPLNGYNIILIYNTKIHIFDILGGPGCKVVLLPYSRDPQKYRKCEFSCSMLGFCYNRLGDLKTSLMRSFCSPDHPRNICESLEKSNFFILIFRVGTPRPGVCTVFFVGFTFIYITALAKQGGGVIVLRVF